MGIVHDIAIKRAPGAVDLREHEGRFVTKNASGELELTTDPAKLVGCIHVPGDKGEATDYFLPNFAGIILVKVASDSGAIKEGDKLILAASGVKPGTTNPVAIAQDAGAANELIEATLI